MARRTKVVYECDRCSKALDSRKDGLVIHGFVAAPEAPTVAIIGQNPNTWEKQPDDVALCWACIRKVAPDPELEVLRARALAASREASRGSSSDDDDLFVPGRGPSGPLPPPELSRGVLTARALCGVPR